MLVTVQFLNKKYLLGFECLAAHGNLLDRMGWEMRDQYIEKTAQVVLACTQEQVPSIPCVVSSFPAVVAHVGGGWVGVGSLGLRPLAS